MRAVRKTNTAITLKKYTQLGTLNIPCVNTEYLCEKEIQLTTVPRKEPEKAPARLSINISATATAKVPIAAITWLTVRLEINTPIATMAPP